MDLNFYCQVISLLTHPNTENEKIVMDFLDEYLNHLKKLVFNCNTKIAFNAEANQFDFMQLYLDTSSKTFDLITRTSLKATHQTRNKLVSLIH